jgi:hypothetical protein
VTNMGASDPNMDASEQRLERLHSYELCAPVLAPVSFLKHGHVCQNLWTYLHV